MKISTRGRYGLRILMDLAKNNTGKPRMIGEICKSQMLSRKYIGRLIIPLCKAGLIVSKRGAHGGYFLKEAPKNITLLRVIEIMEGPISLVACVACPKRCKRVQNGVAHDIGSEMNEKIKAIFAEVTLDQIMNREEGDAKFCV